MASLTRVTAPPVEPLTQAEVWDHLRVNLVGSPAAPADADHIDTLIAAAVAHFDGRDGVLNRALVQQTWDLKLDRFPRATRHNPWGAILVPLPPLRSVTSIAYVDENGATQTLSASLYTVDAASEPGRIVPAYDQTWPVVRDHIDVVTVRFVAGYATDGGSPADYRANVPGAIKAAMKLLIGHWYEHREEVALGTIATQIPAAVDALIASYIARY